MNYIVDDTLSTQLLASLQTMFQMMTSAEFVAALAAKHQMGKPAQSTVTKRLMAIPGFSVKGFASLIGETTEGMLRAAEAA